MIRIAVASGKGGTGKTTVAASLAAVLSETRPVQLLDCDVEAPNAAILLRPSISQTQHVTRPVPAVDGSLCDCCGKCSAFCRFHALATTPNGVLVFPELCHGCGGCAMVCPTGAISESRRVVGEVASGLAGRIRFAEGRLRAGETATVDVIRAVRRCEANDDIILLDAPPGTSCPVVATLEGVDWVLLVTEPTPFGMNDLRLAVEMAQSLNVGIGVVINRDGSGDGRIDSYCASMRLPIAGRIADSRRVAESYSRGELPAGASPEFRRAIESIGAFLTAEVFA
jgi:MinD superfamily P-loop ATPase